MKDVRTTQERIKTILHASALLYKGGGDERVFELMEQYADALSSHPRFMELFEQFRDRMPTDAEAEAMGRELRGIIESIVPPPEMPALAEKVISVVEGEGPAKFPPHACAACGKLYDIYDDGERVTLDLDGRTLTITASNYERGAACRRCTLALCKIAVIKSEANGEEV